MYTPVNAPRSYLHELEIVCQSKVGKHSYLTIFYLAHFQRMMTEENEAMRAKEVAPATPLAQVVVKERAKERVKEKESHPVALTVVSISLSRICVKFTILIKNCNAFLTLTQSKECEYSLEPTR